MSVVELARPELAAELRRLWARLPIPDARWHAHVPQIAAVRDDFARAIEAAAERPDALERFESLLAGGAEPEPDEDAEPWVLAALARLEALPIPEGQHPYLDEILPALEAARLLLAALASAA